MFPFVLFPGGRHAQAPPAPRVSRRTSARLVAASSRLTASSTRAYTGASAGRGASGRETDQEAAEPLRVLEQERVAGVREDGRDPVGDAISHRNGLLHVLHDVLRTVGDEKGNSNVTEPFPAGVFSAIPPADGGVLVDPGLLLDQLGYAVSAVVATAEYRTAGGSARLGVGEEQEEDVLDRGVFLAADLDGPGALRWPYARLAGAAAGDGDGREQFGVVCGEKLSDEAAHRPADQVDLVKALGPDEVHDSVGHLRDRVRCDAVAVARPDVVDGDDATLPGEQVEQTRVPVVEGTLVAVQKQQRDPALGSVFAVTVTGQFSLNIGRLNRFGDVIGHADISLSRFINEWKAGGLPVACFLRRRDRTRATTSVRR